jgi:hypothetical protein
MHINLGVTYKFFEDKSLKNYGRYLMQHEGLSLYVELYVIMFQ